MGRVGNFVFLISIHVISLQAAIIGADDRIQYYEIQNLAQKRLAHSTAVLLKDDDGLLEKTEGGFRLSSKNKTFKEQDNLCSDEPFLNEPSPGFCSSFLVADDLLVTAAHCVTACEKISVVFDFLKNSENSPVDKFLPSSVYHCQKIEAIHKSQDWAVLRLDRPVTNRVPFQLSRKDPALGTSVTLLGFPRGLPLKSAGPAEVVENIHSDPENFFEAHLDAFGGNSGGPVINHTTLEIEGILSVSFGEFEEQSVDPVTKNICQRLRRIPFSEEPVAGWVVKASRFFDAVQNAGK